MSRTQPGGWESGPGLLYTWWRGDQIPALAPPAAFAAEPTDDSNLLAQLGSASREEAVARMHSHNRAYVARLNGEPVGYGWSAATHASIGELDLSFAIPPGNRYLWDFATLPAWRGRGVYPRLLQAILEREASEAERFWIGHEHDNLASGRGIVKAGFTPAVQVERQQAALVLRPLGPPERAAAAARLLGIPLFEAPPDPSMPNRQV